MSGRDAADVDPLGDRAPTSHERLSGQPWDASYGRGPAPWDTGRPQPAVARVADRGGFTGAVLDVGCGTGDNALLIAELGLPVLGVDVAPTALALAREKAAAREKAGARGAAEGGDRSIEVEFALADALRLDRLGRVFDTVLDCGLFHSLDHGERHGYLSGLAAVTRPGGTVYVLCFSDIGADTGPHPVGREEVSAVFSPASGWRVAAIEPERLRTRFHDENGAPAWLATVKRA